MTEYKFSVSSLISASPKIVYGIIADYKNGHPGRILVETNDTGYITTFTVEPREDAKSTYVTFTTEIPGDSKFSKKIEFFFTKFYLPLVYKKELQMLAEEVVKQSKTSS